MRSLVIARFVAVFVGLCGTLACGATTPTEPDPVYELKTETFTGTVKTGGSVAFPFTVTNPGDLQVAITELTPTSTLTMGLAMGYWDTANLNCVQQLSTTTATLNIFFTATPSTAGECCVGIFDTGNVQESSDFILTVRHF